MFTVLCGECEVYEMDGHGPLLLVPNWEAVEGFYLSVFERRSWIRAELVPELTLYRGSGQPT